MQNSVNLGKEKIVFGSDSVIIQKCIATVAGGRTLDVSDWSEDVINAGHVIYRTSDGVYKPLAYTAASGDTAAKYSALPEGATYVGVLRSSLLKKAPEASIMINGVVNKAALSIALPEDFKIATIILTEDETA